MKVVLYAILGVSFCLSAFASNVDPVGRTAIFRSFELVPNEKLVLNLKINKRCSDSNKEKITIEDFESFKSYVSVESKRKNQVRIKHYYIETFSPCENEFVGSFSKQLIIGPFKKKMTHIKITTSDNVQVGTLNK